MTPSADSDAAGTTHTVDFDPASSRVTPLSLTALIHRTVHQCREKRHEVTIDLEVGRLPGLVWARPAPLGELLTTFLCSIARHVDPPEIQLAVETVEVLPRAIVVRFTATARIHPDLIPPGTIGPDLPEPLARRVRRKGGRHGLEGATGTALSWWIELPFDLFIQGNDRLVHEKRRRTLAGPAPARRRHRILLAEDDPIAARAVASTLRQAGYDVAMVPDGRQAVEAARRTTFDLILMDCHMPVMNGFDATEEIRKSEAPGDRHTPIIALTAHTLREDLSHCLAVGMDYYITKPVDLGALSATVRAWCRR